MVRLSNDNFNGKLYFSVLNLNWLSFNHNSHFLYMISWLKNKTKQQLISLWTYFSRLQEEYLALQEEVKVTIEESKVVQEKYKSMYEACRRELAERHAQLEEIRTKVSFCSQCACWFNTLHVVSNTDLNLLKAQQKNSRGNRVNAAFSPRMLFHVN